MEWGRTKKGNKGKFNYKRGRETKNNPFLVSKQGSLREEEEEEEEKEEGREKSSKGMDLWNLSMEILKSCMDSSMILSKNYLGMDC